MQCQCERASERQRKKLASFPSCNLQLASPLPSVRSRLTGVCENTATTRSLAFAVASVVAAAAAAAALALVGPCKVYGDSLAPAA